MIIKTLNKNNFLKSIEEFKCYSAFYPEKTAALFRLIAFVYRPVLADKSTPVDLELPEPIKALDRAANISLKCDSIWRDCFFLHNLQCIYS